MTDLNTLQNRLAVASERNRANGERRNELLAEMKERFGCDTIEELQKKAEEAKAELVKAEADAAEAARRAEEAVAKVEAAVEAAVGVAG